MTLTFVCPFQSRGLYHVKWLGWGDDANTWEPVSNLNCIEKLKEFYLKRLEERENAIPQR